LIPVAAHQELSGLPATRIKEIRKGEIDAALCGLLDQTRV
jgi:hypothetical protein